MARPRNRLSARAVATETRPGFHPDGGNLYLRVAPAGSKSWVFRFTLNGKARMMGLGPVDLVSLSEAREKALEARKLLLDRVDPLEHRRLERASRKAAAASVLTFREAAERFIEAKAPEWSNPKHAKQWEATLEKYAYPVFGHLPVADVDVNLVMKALGTAWTATPETGSRVRGRVEAVLDWATALGHREGDNPARWKGNLKNLLPAPRRIKTVQHFAAMPWADVPGFMQDLRGRKGVSARAVEFAILTAARSGEVRGATWDEIDAAEKVWTVPADRMKASREHRVPLTPRALEIVTELGEAFGTTGLVFPSVDKDKAQLSDMSLTAVLRRMGIKGDVATVHGFRSSFRDWAADRTAFPREVAEACLAHTLGGVEAAYRRSDLFGKRRKLLEAWERFVLTPPAEKGSNVRAIGGGK
ncbi:DUF4102 domain-containing protein [Glycocaulis profundi]|nr:DUF4102 domain-containing protein [Glycocaulis profundi]